MQSGGDGEAELEADAAPRSGAGCLLSGGLGCLAFLAGAVLVAAAFMPRVSASLLRTRLEERVGGRLQGSLDAPGAELTWTGSSRIEDLRLRDPGGRIVLAGDLELPGLTTLFFSGGRPAGLRWQLAEARLDFDGDGACNLARALESRPGVERALLERFPGAGSDPLDGLRAIGLPGLAGHLELEVEAPTLACSGTGGELALELVHLTLTSAPDDPPASFVVELSARQAGRADSEVFLSLGIGEMLVETWGSLALELRLRELDARALGVVSGLGGLVQDLLGERVRSLRLTVEGPPAGGAALRLELASSALDLEARGAWTQSPEGFRLQLETEKLPCAALDVLAGSAGLLAEVLGASVRADVIVQGGGSLDPQCRIVLTGAGGTLELEGTWSDTGLALGAQGLQARLAPGAQARARLLSVFPWIEVPEPAEAGAPLEFWLSEGRIDLRADASRTSGTMTFIAPGLVYRYPERLEGLLRAGELGARSGIGPVHARLAQGRLTFERTPLCFDPDAGSVEGEVELSSGEVELELGVPIARLAQGDPPAGEDLGRVTLRMYGTLGDTRLSVDLDALGELFGAGGEGDLLDRVQGFMGAFGSLLGR